MTFFALEGFPLSVKNRSSRPRGSRFCQGSHTLSNVLCLQQNWQPRGLVLLSVLSILLGVKSRSSRPSRPRTLGVWQPWSDDIPSLPYASGLGSELLNRPDDTLENRTQRQEPK